MLLNGLYNFKTAIKAGYVHPLDPTYLYCGVSQYTNKHNVRAGHKHAILNFI